MASTTDSASRSQIVPSLGLAVAVLAVLTIVRLIGLKFSVVDLFFDESQYWAWSRELAFGYFTKPPLLAWIIAGAEHVCGTSEACVRAPAPVFYFGTCLLVFATTRILYDETVAFFAALATALSPGVIFSSRVISTDVPLLFFWALALLACVKLITGADRRWFAVLGVALGLGLLAKYAMVYFLLGVGLAAWFDRDARELLRRPDFWLAMALAALIVMPNVWWNLTHGLATFRHTGDNIQGSGFKLNVLRAFEFIASQFAVFGPILFTVLLGGFARMASPRLARADRLMLAFALPPLVLITITAILSRAFANWAATAFISGAIVTVAMLIRQGGWKWLNASFALGLVVQAVFLAGDAHAYRIHVPKLGDLYRRTLGWRAVGFEAGQTARRVGAHTIVGDQRDDLASLIYYWRDQPERVLAWPSGNVATHQFEMTRALTDAAPLPILFVSRCNTVGRLTAQFASVEGLPPIVTATGPKSWRTYYAFKLDAPRGPLRPLAPCWSSP